MGRVNIASSQDIEAMRVVGRMAAETLVIVGEQIRAGMSTEDIDRLVVEDTKRRGAKCAPLNYHGFPKSVCTSINEVVCHGIPTTKHVLRDGDIINVDVTTIFNGYHGDTSATFYIGTPTKDATRVTEVSRKSLDLGIAEVREGARLGDIVGLFMALGGGWKDENLKDLPPEGPQAPTKEEITKIEGPVNATLLPTIPKLTFTPF